MGVYEQVKRALQDIVAPEIRALQVEIKRLDEKIDSLSNVEIKRLDEKIDSLSEKFDEKIDSLRNQIISEIKRVDGRIDSLDARLEVAIEVRERLARLEAQVAEKQ